MILTETMTVIEKCACTGAPVTKTVVCTKIHEGMETRLYQCNCCFKTEYRNVIHTENVHDIAQTLKFIHLNNRKKSC